MQRRLKQRQGCWAAGNAQMLPLASMLATRACGVEIVCGPIAYR